MRKLVTALAELLVMAALFAGPSLAQEDEALKDEALKKDLTAVIALHGLPCGGVVAVTVQGESDYAASWDGNKYHVYLNPAGRVIVEPQK